MISTDKRRGDVATRSIFFSRSLGLGESTSPSMKAIDIACPVDSCWDPPPDPLLGRDRAGRRATSRRDRRSLQHKFSTEEPDAHLLAKGNLCGQHRGFNLHGATKVAANDAQGRLALCKYVLRPPLANDRLAIIDHDHVRLDFKKPWSDGTTLIALLKTDDTIKKILSAMGLPTCAPEPWPARPPPAESGGEGGDWLN
jgi:hypothetical protein